MKPTESSVNADIKKLFEAGKLVLGEERTIKNVKAGRARKVFISKNCKADVFADVKRYAEVAGVIVVEIPLTADEVGALCRKQFGVSILSTVD